MTAELVQAAVASYVTAAGIPNLSQVYAVPPFDLADVPWDTITVPGSTSAAVGIVFVDSDDDEGADTSFDGAGGRRVCTYEVSLEVMLWDVSGVFATAAANYDAMVTAIKIALRTDPQLGTATTPGMAGNNQIIQAAYSRLHVERGRPVRLGDGDAPARWAAIQFPVQTFEFST